MIATPTLTYRTIDPDADASLVVANQLDACILTYGDSKRFQGAERYLAWLRDKVEEFPDGFVLVYSGPQCVGHMELQSPYGLTTGYINLFYVAAPFRRQGYGRLMHQFAERYFRSWEVRRVELHVSPLNRPALGFYRRMGYRLTRIEWTDSKLWRMGKTL